MNRLRLAALFALAFALGLPAEAGPVEGDLFGYRIGAKYPVGKETKGYFMILGQAVIQAEEADAPPDFKAVEVITTVKTYTIVNIYGSAEFDDESQAQKFAAKYSDLLGTLYAGRCTKLKAYLEESLKMLCSKSYELTVQHFKPDGPEKKHKIHVGLKMNNESTLGKRLTAQFHQELREMDAEAKRSRLNKAAEDGTLKGLK